MLFLEDHATKPESQIVEVTVGFKGGSAVHVEERSNDMYASVDVVSHRLTEHLRRHHDKLVNNKRGKKNSDGSILEEIVEEVVDEE